MSISSIHIETSSAGALIHNERIFSPDYLISNDKNINEYKSYTNLHISELENRAKEDYQKHSINNRKLPKTATLIKEAILNLNENHTLQDLEKVKNTLEKEYGYKISNMSIHRDEGYIYTDTKNYTMGKNQFKNLEETPYIAELDLKDNKFYEWNLNNNKWVKGNEIKDYKIEKNYHAHIVMLNYDFTKHRTIRNNLKDLSKMQTLVARDLSMERGKCSSTVEAQRIGVEVEQSRKRLNIKEYKIQKRKENELQKELEKEKKKNINLEKELYNFREMQKTITALELTSDEKKELHRLNSQVKNQAATIEELNKKINELTEKNKEIFHPTLKKSDDTPAKYKEVANHYIKENKELKEKVNTLETQNKSLEEQNSILESKVITLEEKINSSANMSDYEAIKKENESLKIENKSLKQKLKDIVNIANEKIKSLFNFKIWNNYRHKQTRADLEYINETKQDYWEELAHYHPKIETLYSENIKNELLKISDFIPGEKEILNPSKMNLEDILNLKKEDFKAFEKEAAKATEELKEYLEENKETVVHIRKNF